MYSGFSATAIGYSHKEKNKPCQDASNFETGIDYAIVAVSDGHGGEKYFRSATGSMLAVSVALRCLKTFLSEYRDRLIDVRDHQRDELLKNLERYIIVQWRTEIEKDFNSTPLNGHETDLCKELGITPEEFQASFYGATLLFACMTPEYSFAAQIGDGKCIFLHDNGTESSPIAEDERLGFGITTSLCSSDAIDNFRHCFVPSSHPPSVSAVFLSTDGVADSYKPESLLRFFRKILDQMRVDTDFARKQLEEWLPALSERGSRDDATIAGIFKKDESARYPEATSSTQPQSVSDSFEALAKNISSTNVLKDE